MAIDESGGLRGRIDCISRTGVQGLALALALHGGGTVEAGYAGPHRATLAGLARRGLLEPVPDHPGERRPWRYRLTAAGRVAAESSPAVRGWIEGWEQHR